MGFVQLFQTTKKRVRKRLSKIKHGFLDWAKEECYFLYLGSWNRRNIYVMGTPMHTNVGDNAIAYAELLFLKSCGIPGKNIKEITMEEYKLYRQRILRTLRVHKRFICLHGGGNMGNQWPEEEQLRREMMSGMPDNPMAILPQTFFYTDDAAGREEYSNSIPYYNGRKDLTIVAREQTSFEKMRKAYPNTRVILTPDVVLTMDPESLGIDHKERRGILFVLRADGERVLSDVQTDALFQTVESMGQEYRITDMITEHLVTKNNRREIIEDKLNEFAGAEIVVTDRLHAMVFAALSGTPCVVLKNNNHKIIGTYDWIRDLKFIRFAENIKQAEEYLHELNRTATYGYDPSILAPYYKELRATLQQYRD